MWENIVTIVTDLNMYYVIDGGIGYCKLTLDIKQERYVNIE